MSIERWLLARSKENFVLFHKKELFHLLETGKLHRDCSPGMVRKALEFDIIFTSRKGSLGPCYGVTDYTINVLMDLSKMTANVARKGFGNAPHGRIDPDSEMSLITVQEGNKVE